jgi:hypothetical protein
MQIALLAFDGIMRVVFYILLGVAVYRLFTIGADLAEIKEILRDFKRSSEVASLAAAVGNAGGVDTASTVPEALHSP